MMGVTQAAGLSLKWFKDQFCQDLVKEAEETGADVYDQINKDVAAVAPGSNRLLYLPYLMGERTPHLDPDCRGVFFRTVCYPYKKASAAGRHGRCYIFSL